MIFIQTGHDVQQLVFFPVTKKKKENAGRHETWSMITESHR